MPPSSNPLFTRDRLPEGVTPATGTDPERFGAYRVVGRIGAGGMGAVYAGITDDGGTAAVKVVHSQFAADPEFRARFAREVGLVSRVRATCAPAFLGADTEAATPWMATEYVPGPTLRQHVKRNGPLTGGMLTAFAVGLAEALTAIHAAGVVHRDLKPGNVILSPDGPKVLDFGIARAADGTVLTATGGLHGTPGWVSPEQYEGADATGYSDMFAWGGMVALAATGRDPFGKGAVDGIIHRSRYEEPDLDGVPDHLSSLVRRSLSKDPDDRPRADEALTELTRGWSATRIIPAGTPPLDGVGATGTDALPTEIVPEILATEWTGISAPAVRRVRRPARTALLSGTAVVLVAVFIGGWLFVRSDEGPPPSNGEGSEEAGNGGGEGTSLLIESEPEDGTGVVEQAVDLVERAESFEAVHVTTGIPPADYSEVHRYTEDPEPRYSFSGYGGPMTLEWLEVGEDPVDTIYQVIPSYSTIEASEGYFRDSEYGRNLGERQGRNGFMADLVTLAEEGTELVYHGEQQVPAGDEPEIEGLDTDTSGRTGHHYSGTFVESGYLGPDDETEREVSFSLWVGDDGYPLRFERLAVNGEAEEIPEELRDPGDAPPVDAAGQKVFFLRFDEPVEIEVPDESEIEDRG
ncbi:serine/threonine-protein kinase [Nocardiopsis alba]|uniref:serine/threonine-protein kinase n=1 Tax=Nocardiopsis alba TaxID=53437 RepID=UPI0035DCBF91